ETRSRRAERGYRASLGKRRFRRKICRWAFVRTIPYLACGTRSPSSVQDRAEERMDLTLPRGSIPRAQRSHSFASGAAARSPTPPHFAVSRQNQYARVVPSPPLDSALLRCKLREELLDLRRHKNVLGARLVRGATSEMAEVAWNLDVGRVLDPPIEFACQVARQRTIGHAWHQQGFRLHLCERLA